MLFRSLYDKPASYERPIATNGAYSNGGPSELQYANVAAAMGIGAGGEQRDVVMEEQGTPPGTPPSKRRALPGEGGEGGV